MPLPDAERAIELGGALDLVRTLAPMRQGRHDPTFVLEPRDAWRATRNPDGPVTLHLHLESPTRLVARAWGAGAAQAVAGAADLVGERDEIEAFARLLDRVETPERGLVRELHRRHPGLRLPRSGAVVEAIVPVILGQRVTGLQARRSYHRLVRNHGEPAPHSPPGRPLRLPPTPQVLAALPSWRYHRYDVEGRRADTIRRACHHAARLDETAAMGAEQAAARLRAIPGVGAWTVAEVLRVTHGDPDAVSVGDYHLPNQVAWAFRGVPRATDDEMLRILSPYRGHRGRVTRLVELSGIGAPRFGPRRPLHEITRL